MSAVLSDAHVHDTTPRLDEIALRRKRYRLREVFKQASPSDAGSASTATLVSMSYKWPLGYLGEIPIAEVYQGDTQSISAGASLVHKGEPLYLDEVGTAATGVTELVEATTASAVERMLTRQLTDLLVMAEDERFEDGMDSNLGLGLRVLLRDFSLEFAKVLEGLLKRNGINARVLSEILYTLGRIRDEATKDWRLAILVGFLKSTSADIRDAAGVGLAFLAETKALPYLDEAIRREENQTLREDLQGVVEQLAG